MSERISGAEIEERAVDWTKPNSASRLWVLRLANQVKADADLAARLAAAERERDEWMGRASVHIPVDTKTRSAAANWRAFVACRDHPMRVPGTIVYYSHEHGVWTIYTNPHGHSIAAPDFPALLAKLDALTPKPKPEVWRWRFKDGTLSESVSTPEDLRHLGHSFDGTPVREVRNPAGDVLLLREGRPVPEGFQ